MVQPYEHYIDACLSGVLGDRGLSPDLLATLKERAQPAIRHLREALAAGQASHFGLAARRDDLAELTRVADRFRDRYEHVIVFGTGGAIHGAQALVALAGRKERERVHFADNLDGRGLSELLDTLDPRSTSVLALSRSGDTVSTLAQVIAATGWLRQNRRVSNAAEHICAVTLPGDSPLRRFCTSLGIQMVDHDPAVSGRFSVLAGMGLLPAMTAGLDARAVRTGASLVFEAAIAETDSAPLTAAAVAVGLAMEQRRGLQVTLAYADALAPFTQWQRQIVAECLGRDQRGFTSLPALGPADQHGQLQLWLDGPPDKTFTVLTSAQGHPGPELPSDLLSDSELSYLDGQTFGGIIHTQARATIETLVSHGHPTRLIRLPRLDERSVGGLIMHVMLEVIFSAHLLGVDPYGPPAADAGKSLTKTHLKNATLRRS